MATLSGNIKHVVVLMLENRSLDNVFGYLYPDRPDFDGLNNPQASGNPAPDGSTIAPWTDPAGPNSATLPTPDPGELFTDITQQLFGSGAQTAPPQMQGFTTNYVRHGGNARNIMHCFSREELPALTQLAQSYAVSDRWFASAPCQTWPNRFFAHTGTANGYENNDMAGFPFPMQTIFNELAPTHKWRIYFHDFAQATLLQRLWPYFASFRPFSEFLADVDSSDMPSYSFIEPRYYPGLQMPNDMHPPHNVAYGDALVAQVYNAVRSSPNWASTLLIITFDEHGGCYDHVPPPAAVPPETPRPGQVFDFDRYGVRVPAVIVSPYTKAGTILRAAGPQPFDHTSILRTVRTCFGLQTPLSAREAAAPDLGAALNDALNLDRAPARLNVNAPQASGGELQAAQSAVPNRLQTLLHDIAAKLAPLTAPGASVAQHLQTVVQPNPLAPPMSGNAADAGQYAAKVMQALSGMQPPPPPPQPLPNPLGDPYFGGS